MIALVTDYFRRSWLLGLLACAAVFAFEVIVNRVFLQIQQQGGGSPLTRVMPKWIQSAFNIGPSSMTELNGFISVTYQHPFLLAVLLALPVALITAFLTGDVEKRSIALVLSRPVSRFQIVTAVALVVLFWSAAVVAGAYVGVISGSHWTGLLESLNRSGLLRATVNLAALILAFTGISAAISSMLSVRGDAVGWSLTIVLVMYVWNFLAQVWYGGAGMANYSLFRFYQPTQILMQDQAATPDAWILTITGVAGWAVSAVAFRFRSFAV